MVKERFYSASLTREETELLWLVTTSAVVTGQLPAEQDEMCLELSQRLARKLGKRWYREGLEEPSCP
jgi:hypothetical protein